MKIFYTVIISVFISAAAFAQAGELDSTFGTNGIVTTAIGTGALAYSVAIQPDGKIVAAGISGISISLNDFALVRYNTDGTLDSSFGMVGKVTTAIGSFNDDAYSVAIQSDGKIVAAGSSANGTGYDFALVRYNMDGTLDSSFSTDGKATTAIGSGIDIAYSVAIQPDGKIVAAGYSGPLYNFDFALVRYHSDGTLDTSFGTDGKVITDIGSGDDVARSVAIQPDGKIVVAGLSFNLSDKDFALVRYNTDGTLDNSFSTDGMVTTAIGSGDDDAYSVTIQPDGKIVAVGYSFSYSMNDDFALVRYNTDGNLDSSFGTEGKVTTAIGSGGDYANSAATQPDGKIVAAGESFNGTIPDFALVRYNTDGTLDISFSTDGKVTTAIGSLAQANSVAIQPDGKIVSAGYIFNDTDFDFALARYISGLNVGIATFTTTQTSTLIYPNPIQQTEQLEYTLTNDEVLTLSLCDVNGRVVKNFFTQQKRTAGAHKEQLNMGALTAGSYFLTLSNGAGVVSVKVVKQ